MQNTTQQTKGLYLREKSQLALEQCFRRCTRNSQDQKGISNRQQTCIEYCSVKFTNAYAFAFDVVMNGGVSRLPESELRVRKLAS